MTTAAVDVEAEYRAHNLRVLKFDVQELEALSKSGAGTPLLGRLAMHNTPLRLSPGRRETVGRVESRAFVKIFDDIESKVFAIGVKDMIQVKDCRLTLGTKAYRRGKCANDAPIIQRIKNAGIGIQGMLNQHAMAYGATGLSSEIGPAVNALDPNILPGGSSSGSAVAVARRFVDFSLGTDTGGSIRIPAALNAVVGFKPTFGRIPIEGVVPLAPSLDHVGPLASNVQKTAALFSIIDSGAAPVDGASLAEEPRLVIGVPARFFLDELDDSTYCNFVRSVHDLKTSGRVKIVVVDLPGAEVVTSAHLAIIATEALQTARRLIGSNLKELPNDVGHRLSRGQLISDETYSKAKYFQNAWSHSVEAAFGSCHAIITPTLPLHWPHIRLENVKLNSITVPMQTALTRLTAPFNLSGHPAVSIPYRRSSGRLPMSLQIVGPKLFDAELLSFAQEVEGLLDPI